VERDGPGLVGPGLLLEIRAYPRVDIGNGTQTIMVSVRITGVRSQSLRMVSLMIYTINVHMLPPL
jgi:hypothetical protein